MASRREGVLSNYREEVDRSYAGVQVRSGIREFQEGSVNLVESNGYSRVEVKATKS